MLCAACIDECQDADEVRAFVLFMPHAFKKIRDPFFVAG
jgi:hypothetical protein